MPNHKKNITIQLRLSKTLITGIILLGIIGLIGGLFYSNINTMKKTAAMGGVPPVSVATARVGLMQWPVETAAIGTIVPAQSVDLSFESSGTVTEIGFRSGRKVLRDDLIAKLDDSRERALLTAAEAARTLARIDFDRSKRLLDEKTISQAEFDLAEAEHRQALANVRSIEADIARKRLVAPFEGRLGIRRISLGQYLNAGDPVVALSSLSPVHATFHLPQKDLSYLKVGLPVVARSDAFAGESIAGEISAINAEIDPRTRMIEVRATLPNLEGRLVGGMFVNLSVRRSRARQIRAVPATSILYASYGNSIYTVGPSSEGPEYVAARKFVKLGERRGDFVEVLEGLQPDERIVTDGAFKLYPGATVILGDERAPGFELEPNPADA